MSVQAVKKFANFDWPKEWRSWVFESGVRWYAKNRTYITGGLSLALYARVWRGNLGALLPQKKIEFGIGGDATCCCLVGITRTPVSSSSIFYHVFSSSPTPPSEFLCKFGQITRLLTMYVPPACPSVIVRNAVWSRQNGISWRLARSKALLHDIDSDSVINHSVSFDLLMRCPTASVVLSLYKLTRWSDHRKHAAVSLMVDVLRVVCCSYRQTDRRRADGVTVVTLLRLFWFAITAISLSLSWWPIDRVQQLTDWCRVVDALLLLLLLLTFNDWCHSPTVNTLLQSVGSHYRQVQASRLGYCILRSGLGACERRGVKHVCSSYVVVIQRWCGRTIVFPSD